MKNSSGNNRGTNLANAATLRWTGHATAAASAPNVTVAEPLLTIGKTATPTVGDAGDTIVYDITITHAPATNGADAFDVDWTDTIPDGLTYVPGSLELVSGPATSTLSGSDPDLHVTWANSFTQGSVAHLRFSATLDADVPSGSSYRNTATVTWTSLPGAHTSPPLSDFLTLLTGPPYQASKHRREKVPLGPPNGDQTTPDTLDRVGGRQRATADTSAARSAGHVSCSPSPV